VSDPCRPPLPRSSRHEPRRHLRASIRHALPTPDPGILRLPLSTTCRAVPCLVPSHGHHDRPRPPTTDDADPHPTAGIAADPRATNNAPSLSTAVTTRSRPPASCRRRRPPRQRLPSVLPLHRHIAVHHCNIISSSARRRMCPAHVSPLAQLDAADHLRPHYQIMPPLALPLQFADAQVPAATSPHATAGIAQQFTDAHAPALASSTQGLESLALLAQAGLASLGSLRSSIAAKCTIVKRRTVSSCPVLMPVPSRPTTPSCPAHQTPASTPFWGDERPHFYRTTLCHLSSETAASNFKLLQTCRHRCCHQTRSPAPVPPERTTPLAPPSRGDGAHGSAAMATPPLSSDVDTPNP